MADDLNDEWWLDDKKQEEKEDRFKDVEVSLPGEKGQGVKRKLEASKEKAKGKRAKKESSRKKKIQRRKITDESPEDLAKAGVAEDLRTMMAKELKDRLSADALEDLLPDAETDFFPANKDGASPSDYMRSILPNWRAKVKKSLFMKKPGSPAVLVVTSSAIRAVELNRQMKDFLGDKAKAAKLFSKHMKVEEQTKFLSKTVCQVGIGTPNRLLVLLKSGALQTEDLVAVVLDWNWRDSKSKRLPDIPQVCRDLVTLLKDFGAEWLQASPCKLALL